MALVLQKAAGLHRKPSGHTISTQIGGNSDMPVLCAREKFLEGNRAAAINDLRLAVLFDYRLS
jgi:hypothetical protein